MGEADLGTTSIDIETGDSGATSTRDAAELSVPGVVAPSRDGERVFGVQPDQLVAGRYRIVRFLGRGGAGDIHEAIDQHLGSPVALKILHRTASDADHIERLRQELLLARKVSHPSVCRVFDLGRHDGPEPIWFITMELLGGESLRDQMQRRGPLPLDEVSAIADQLVAALSAAHEADVIHRDLTPANIFLVPADGRTRAVITDFGLAVGGDQESPHLRTAGTPAYMAPEQVTGQPATPATDVFALGVVLHEALTGTLPWRGRTAYETAALRLTQPPRRLRAVLPDVPVSWERAILRCLERDPARRFAIVGEVSAALRAPPRSRAPRMAALSGIAAALAGAALWIARGGGGGSAPLPPVDVDPRGPIALAFTIRGSSVMIEGVHELAGGDLVIAGHANTPFEPRGVEIGTCPRGRRCGFVARLSSRAEVRWARLLETGSDVRLHGPLIGGQQVVVAAKFFGTARFAGEPEAPGPLDAFVLALDLRSGDTRWFRRLGVGMHVRGLAGDPDGNIYLTGDVKGAVAWTGAWQVLPDRPADAVTGLLAALDPTGAPRWVRWVEGQKRAKFFAVSASADGLLWSGNIEGPVRGPDVSLPAGRHDLLFHLNAHDGGLRWVRDYPNAGVKAVTFSGDGGALLAGDLIETIQLGAHSATSTGEADCWAARIDLATGQPRWLTSFGGPDYDTVTGLAATPSAIWLVGRTGRDFAGGALAAPRWGGDDAFLVRLDPAGAARRAWTFGGEGGDKARALSVGPSGVWLGGNFQHAMKAGSFMLEGTGVYDGFIVRLAPGEAP
ncbi:MAG TPA: protein kinase [Kofleriaceae bacterium]|nr:protein kinase [Kofleriaceae bacterium]